MLRGLHQVNSRHFPKLDLLANQLKGYITLASGVQVW